MILICMQIYFYLFISKYILRYLSIFVNLPFFILFQGLPTQKVVNLLEGYGDDPRDRYPNKWGGRPLHERAGSIATLARAHKRDR